jgi:uncharacterized protein YbjQ (UPF0145 family)
MNADVIELLVQVGIVLGLLALGLFAGTHFERRHFSRLAEREAAHKHVVITQLKCFPGGALADPIPKMFVAESVIASDYFKSFFSAIRKFFGGELGRYLSLLERARREAQMQLVEQAVAEGYDTICNLRYDTADIGGALNPRKGTVAVAIIASGTAYKRKPRVTTAPVAASAN